jgi:hypothetical protein
MEGTPNIPKNTDSQINKEEIVIQMSGYIIEEHFE